MRTCDGLTRRRREGSGAQGREQVDKVRGGELISCRGQIKQGRSESPGGRAGVAPRTEGGVRRGAGPAHAALLGPKGVSQVLAGAIGWDLGPEAFPSLRVGSGSERAGLAVTPFTGFIMASGQLRATETQWADKEKRTSLGRY